MRWVRRAVVSILPRLYDLANVLTQLLFAFCLPQDELLEELEELVQQELDTKMLETPGPVIYSPVPSHEPGISPKNATSVTKISIVCRRAEALPATFFVGERCR